MKRDIESYDDMNSSKLTMERVDVDSRGLKIVGHLLRLNINDSEPFYFDRGLIRHMQLLLGDT